MKVYDAPAIRNVALVGHGGSGKTQLVATMLFVAGAVNRLGRVDDGTTVTDFDDEEIARKHTLSSSLAHAEWQKTKINFIDTPEMANFLSDARAALPEGAPVLLSFFDRRGTSVRFRSVVRVGNLVRRLLGRDALEPGDALAPLYAHFFVKDEIVSELGEAGFDLVHYGTDPYAHAVGVARAR